MLQVEENSVQGIYPYAEDSENQGRLLLPQTHEPVRSK